MTEMVDDDDYSDCVYYIDATDNSWDVSEEITITEGDNVDLCESMEVVTSLLLSLNSA